MKCARCGAEGSTVTIRDGEAGSSPPLCLDCFGGVAKMAKLVHEGNLERLLEDVRVILDEHLPRVEECILAASGKPAGITIKIAWRCEEYGYHVSVDGKATLPATSFERKVRLAGEQMELL